MAANIDNDSVIPPPTPALIAALPDCVQGWQPDASGVAAGDEHLILALRCYAAAGLWNDAIKTRLCAGVPRAGTMQEPLGPRAFTPPFRQTITVEVSPEELHKLVRALESDAERAAQCSDQAGYADYLFRRVAALREAAR